MNLYHNICKKFATLILLNLFIFSSSYSSAIKHVDTAVEDARVLMEEVSICKTSPFDKIEPKEQLPEPGHFFRTSDSAETIDGIYTRTALYYDQSLFSDSKESTVTKQKIMGLDRTKAKNYLAAFFFGVWSYGPENTTIQEIEVPIREIMRSESSETDDESDEAMYTLKDGGKHSYGPRKIWKTQHEPRENDNDDGKIYSYTPCKGQHTETVFIEYVKSKQAALWNYFMHASETCEVKQNAKLDLMGFKLISSNDACDSCYKDLYELQKNYRNCLKSLKSTTTRKTPVPFVITFEADTFYHPQNDKHYGSSLFFYPARIKPLLKLASKNEDDSHQCTLVYGAEAREDEEEIKHSNSVTLKEYEQPQFVLMRVNSGAAVKVKLN